MPQSKRYLDYFISIEKDRWHKVKDYAPSNPERFLHYLEMLPFPGRMVSEDKSEFMIIGEL